MRKGMDLKKILTWILIAGISALFILFFQSPGGFGNSGLVVGEVSGRNITADYGSEYVRLFEANISQYREYSKAQTIDEVTDYQIKRSVFNQIAGRQLMAKFSEKIGMYTFDEEVLRGIKQFPDFRDEEGNYSESRYQYFVQNGTLNTKQRIEKQVRESLKVRRLIESPLFGWFPTSKAEVSEYLKVENIRKRAVIAWYDLGQDIYDSVTDEHLKDHYEKNQSNFLGRSLAEAAEEVKESYLRENFQIIADEKKSAKRSELEKDLAAGSFSSGFVQSANRLGMRVITTSPFSISEVSFRDQNGDDITEIPVDELLDDIFILPKGGISSVIELGNRLILVQVTDVQIEKGTDVDSMRGDIYTDELREQQQQNIMQAFQDNLFNEGGVKFLLPPPTNSFADLL